MSATLAPPPVPTQEAPTKADAFVVSCIDPRTSGGVANLFSALGREDRYSELRIAGAALAAYDPASPAATVLWENLAASRKLHGIRKVTFLNHRDCGAMQIWAGRRLADDPMEEQRRHTEVLTRAAEEVRRRHPDLLVELKLMDLDGTAQVIPCAACIPAGFHPNSVGPAAQLLADVPPEGMVFTPSRMQGTQPDPQGFAALVYVRAEGPPLSAEAELALLSEGITRYGLTARAAQEVSGSVLATLRPTGAGATRDVREVLRTRADTAGRIGQQDVRAAGRLYRRLCGPGISYLESERRAATLAEEEGLVPRPKGPWPFRSTSWFRTLLQPLPATPKAKVGRRMTPRIATLALAALLAMATPAAAQEQSGWLDRFNRQVFQLNEQLFTGLDALRQALLDSFAVPDWLSTGAGNILANTVNEPITAPSHALSGDFGHAAASLRRFGTNLTLGALGMRDVATEMGMEVPRNDIGLALCCHGVPDGPYVVLPIVGPRTMRDAISDLVVTNAIIYVALTPIFEPMPGLMTILVIEVLDGAAALAVARQIDSIPESGGTFEEVYDRYVARRTLRCSGAKRGAGMHMRAGVPARRTDQQKDRDL